MIKGWFKYNKGTKRSMNRTELIATYVFHNYFLIREDLRRNTKDKLFYGTCPGKTFKKVLV